MERTKDFEEENTSFWLLTKYILQEDKQLKKLTKLYMWNPIGKRLAYWQNILMPRILVVFESWQCQLISQLSIYYYASSSR